jgi:hypothetical protein
MPFRILSSIAFPVLGRLNPGENGRAVLLGACEMRIDVFDNHEETVNEIGHLLPAG